jgi:hypothetical protein
MNFILPYNVVVVLGFAGFHSRERQEAEERDRLRREQEERFRREEVLQYAVLRLQVPHATTDDYSTLKLCFIVHILLYGCPVVEALSVGSTLLQFAVLPTSHTPPPVGDSSALQTPPHTRSIPQFKEHSRSNGLRPWDSEFVLALFTSG